MKKVEKSISIWDNDFKAAVRKKEGLLQHRAYELGGKIEKLGFDAECLGEDLDTLFTKPKVGKESTVPLDSTQLAGFYPEKTIAALNNLNHSSYDLFKRYYSMLISKDAKPLLNHSFPTKNPLANIIEILAEDAQIKIKNLKENKTAPDQYNSIIQRLEALIKGSTDFQTEVSLLFHEMERYRGIRSNGYSFDEVSFLDCVSIYSGLLPQGLLFEELRKTSNSKSVGTYHSVMKKLAERGCLCYGPWDALKWGHYKHKKEVLEEIKKEKKITKPKTWILLKPKVEGIFS